MRLKWIQLFIVIAFLQSLCECFDPVTMVASGAIFGAMSLAWQWFGTCLLNECCTDSYISLNETGLKRDLNSRLHGQHLVIPTVLKSMKGHLNNENPSKPLVLSFHGWTGGGKNFVSRIIVENLYVKGERSSYVHLFNSEIHFKHEHKVDEYKDQLHRWIYHNVSECGQSIFIFDEMDHMPEGMIDVLIPFLGHNTHVDKVDFRKTIFIFLSNTGGDMITKSVLKHWESGKPRQEIKLGDMQEILELSAYNQQSGLRKSKLVHKHLIDHFVPFLPLEKTHIRKCIIDEFRQQHVTKYAESDVEEVLNELQWFPKDLNLFSKSGCKKVAQKIALLELD